MILKSGHHWPIDASEINEGTDLEFQSKYRHLIDLSHITKQFSKEILGVISNLPDLVSFMSNGYLSKLDVKDCFNSMKLESDNLRDSDPKNLTRGINYDPKRHQEAAQIFGLYSYLEGKQYLRITSLPQGGSSSCQLSSFIIAQTLRPINHLDPALSYLDFIKRATCYDLEPYHNKVKYGHTEKNEKQKRDGEKEEQTKEKRVTSLKKLNCDKKVERKETQIKNRGKIGRRDKMVENIAKFGGKYDKDGAWNMLDADAYRAKELTVTYMDDVGATSSANLVVMQHMGITGKS